jgi:hypothetical protein
MAKRTRPGTGPIKSRPDKARPAMACQAIGPCQKGLRANWPSAQAWHTELIFEPGWPNKHGFVE